MTHPIFFSFEISFASKNSSPKPPGSSRSTVDRKTCAWEKVPVANPRADRELAEHLADGANIRETFSIWIPFADIAVGMKTSGMRKAL